MAQIKISPKTEEVKIVLDLPEQTYIYVPISCDSKPIRNTDFYLFATGDKVVRSIVVEQCDTGILVCSRADKDLIRSTLLALNSAVPKEEKCSRYDPNSDRTCVHAPNESKPIARSVASPNDAGRVVPSTNLNMMPPDARLSVPQRIYLSGKMGGIKNHNYPEFRRVARWLRDKGFEVFDPSNNDPTLPRHILMEIDLREVLRCDFVVVMKGWEYSEGACGEVATARLVRKPVYQLHDRDDEVGDEEDYVPDYIFEPVTRFDYGSVRYGANAKDTRPTVSAYRSLYESYMLEHNRMIIPVPK